MAQADGIDLAAVLAGYERGLRPLAVTEPGGCAPDTEQPGRLTAGLGDDLALLATKIAPTIGTEQVDAWIYVMGRALADLPGRVAREAAAAALHRPMRFLNEVETVIREEAEAVTLRHATALRRLRAMVAEIERAANPPPALPETDEAASPEEIARIIATVSDPGLKGVLSKIARGQGWIDDGERSDYVPHESEAA